MDIIKGATVQVVSTIYSYWTGETGTSIIANLTGASGNLYAKKRDGDLDANAVFTKAGVITDALNGVMTFTIAAADTNGLSLTPLVYEIVVKLQDGTYIRNGVQPLILKANVGKTLF